MAYPTPYLYPYWEPYPTTYLDETYPEPGSHQLRVPFPYWSHKFSKWLHDKDADVHNPKADVRETASKFYIEVELPGLEHKSDLVLKWLSTRSILVSCDLRRKSIEEEKGSDENTKVSNTEVGPGAVQNKPASDGFKAAPANSETKGAADDSPSTKKPEDHEHKHPFHLTVGERNIGHNSRAFHFPVDVEREKMTAKLAAGLLRLEVPKRHHEKVPHHEIDVQF